MKEELVSMSFDKLFTEFPYAIDYFNSRGVKCEHKDINLTQYISSLKENDDEAKAIGGQELLRGFINFMESMEKLLDKKASGVESVTIVGGVDKTGKAEDIVITLKPGDILAIVGPTGSGKSRLLEDIEWIAQGDTPTRRKILINGKVPEQDIRFSGDRKLVAQISQNMNFVIDMTVGEFVAMHARSRLLDNVEELVAAVVEMGNELAGESFTRDTPVTALSGGQSRALMIGDTAILSLSPIVLIDEIENAGVDRKKALELLVKKEKIVLMATHDPILALMGERRIVIKNGGINKIIETSERERVNTYKLGELDRKLVELRNKIRNGEMLDFDLSYIFSDGEEPCNKIGSATKFKK